MMDEPSSVPQHLVEGKPIRVVPAVTTPSSSAPSATQSWVEVASVEQLPPGSWRVVDVEGAAVAVFNLDGQYFAIEDVCTHDGGTLTGGAVEGDQIVCPRHGARFSIKTGAVLCPPAYEPIACLPVRVRAGIIQVRDNRWD
ncbi:MAG: Rieske (2Fe-2S) protein [Burkholderiales bacterium]